MSQVDYFWPPIHYDPFTLSLSIKKHWHHLCERLEIYTKETVEHLILATCAYALLCVLLYLTAGRWRARGRPEARALLVTAHPDDECMFFGPTVLHLARNDVKVHLLCLSTGGDHRRKAELYAACRVLGIEAARVTVVNHTHLPDRMGAKWPVDVVAKLVLQQVETYGINTLVTFDRHGVSYHLNHSSIYYAIAHLSIERKLPKGCNVYVLETVNILRKYWLLLDIPISFLLSRTRYLATYSERAIIHQAMKQHKSQLVWFRRLYMTFSRYMLINSLQRMDVSDIELDLEVDD